MKTSIDFDCDDLITKRKKSPCVSPTPLAEVVYMDLPEHERELSTSPKEDKHQVCSHCLSYFSRNEYYLRGIQDREDILLHIKKYAPRITCFGEVNPMTIINGLDCMLEHGDIEYHEAIHVMYEVKTMYDEIYVRSTPSTLNFYEEYPSTMKELNENTIQMGFVSRPRLHMTQKEINSFASKHGLDFDYHYGLIMDALYEYESAMTPN